jgi:hypothetical protein
VHVLEKRLQALKTEHGLDFDVEKITDLNEIISYGIMMTPGIVINGVVKSIGTILLQWIKA